MAVVTGGDGCGYCDGSSPAPESHSVKVFRQFWQVEGEEGGEGDIVLAHHFCVDPEKEELDSCCGRKSNSCCERNLILAVKEI